MTVLLARKKIDLEEMYTKLQNLKSKEKKRASQLIKDTREAVTQNVAMSKNMSQKLAKKKINPEEIIPIFEDENGTYKMKAWIISPSFEGMASRPEPPALASNTAER